MVLIISLGYLCVGHRNLVKSKLIILRVVGGGGDIEHHCSKLSLQTKHIKALCCLL
jgi:hypothetical protein